MKPADPISTDTSHLSQIFRALGHRNFRFYLLGQGVSLIGTFMQQTATSWLVWRLTHRKVVLGVVGFSAMLPMFVLTPLGGVLADRRERRPILTVTQAVAMAQALLLAVLVVTGVVAVWQIIALSALLGVVNAFDTPTRQAFVVDLLDRRDDLPNAIALSSSVVNLARALGPAVAGVVIAAAGEASCFLFNALSFLAVILALWAMRLPRRATAGPQRHVRHQLLEGFTDAFGFAPIRSILILAAIVSFMGMPYMILMPVFAEELLHGNADTLGFLTGATGVGALMGAAYLAGRRSVVGLGRIIPLTAALFGGALVAFSFSRILWLSLVLAAIGGFGMMVNMAASNTLLQTIVDDDKRGRVMSLYMMAFLGMAPFGSLSAGALADKIGAPTTLAAGGIVCIAGALVFATRLPRLREKVRPIYVQRGILPEVSAAIQTAAELTVPPEE